MAVEDSNFAKKNLNITWLDLKNAFGSLPHATLMQLFDSIPFPTNLNKILKDIYTIPLDPDPGYVASSSETTRPQRRVLDIEGTEPEHAATTPTEATTSMLRQAGAPSPFYSPVLFDVVPNVFDVKVPRPLTPSKHGNHAGFVNSYFDSSDPPSINVDEASTNHPPTPTRTTTTPAATSTSPAVLLDAPLFVDLKKLHRS